MNAGREGGTHLSAFAHGVGLPAKVFTGLMHHCDWVATIVEGAAAGNKDGSPRQPQAPGNPRGSGGRRARRAT